MAIYAKHEQITEEGMSMKNSYDAIIARLKAKRITYEILEHEPVFTMEDVINNIDIPLELQVKSLAVSWQDPYSDQQMVAICGLSATGKLDFKLVAGVLGVSRSKLKMINPKDSMRLLGMPYGAIGLIAPKGNPVILVSEYFSKSEILYFGVGRNDRTIKLSKNNLLNISDIKFATIERQ